MFYSWLHLIALVVYLGAVIGFWFMLLPAVAVLEKHDEKVRYFVRGLKFYNPLQVGSLGIILLMAAKKPSLAQFWAIVKAEMPISAAAAAAMRQ